MEILCAYIRENAPADEAVEYPDEYDREKFDEISASLPRPRTDIQTAITVIGRRTPKQIELERDPVSPSDKRKYRLDLRNANLRNCDMSDLDFSFSLMSGAEMQGAYLTGAKMQGANLFGAKMDSDTSFKPAFLQAAGFREVDYTDVNMKDDQMADTFGDASVVLPPNVTRPSHWPDEKLDWSDFFTQWRAYKKSIGYTDPVI